MQAEVEINAKKQPYQLDKARELLAGAHKLYSAKGKQVVEVDLKRQALSEEDIIKLMLGPTGNLRAPTVVHGKTVVVGFNQEVYVKVLG